MLKTTSVADRVHSTEVEDENLKQDGETIQVQNWGKKEPVQKNRKDKTKSQKSAKSKK